ncbi:LLM class flavin-dependent oxidoreductase [Nocardiopsis composta]
MRFGVPSAWSTRTAGTTWPSPQTSSASTRCGSPSTWCWPPGPACGGTPADGRRSGRPPRSTTPRSGWPRWPRRPAPSGWGPPSTCSGCATLASARAFATLDGIAGGRTVLGAGAGWYRAEWDAVGAPFAERGRRLDEAIGVLRRLWSEEAVAHGGPHFPFPEVAFEPKPPRRAIPILIGGESPAALRRAARNDGWISMPAPPERVAAAAAELRRLRAEAGRDAAPFEVVAHAEGGCRPDETAAWTAAGANTLVVRPWERGRGALAAIERFARDHALASRGPTGATARRG